MIFYCTYREDPIHFLFSHRDVWVIKLLNFEYLSARSIHIYEKQLRKQSKKKIAI